MAYHYRLLKNDIVTHNITLDEIVSMWDGIKS
jgi:hypothetical protein